MFSNQYLSELEKFLEKSQLIIEQPLVPYLL